MIDASVKSPKKVFLLAEKLLTWTRKGQNHDFEMQIRMIKKNGSKQSFMIKRLKEQLFQDVVLLFVLEESWRRVLKKSFEPESRRHPRDQCQ